MPSPVSYSFSTVCRRRGWCSSPLRSGHQRPAGRPGRRGDRSEGPGVERCGLLDGAGGRPVAGGTGGGLPGAPECVGAFTEHAARLRAGPEAVDGVPPRAAGRLGWRGCGVGVPVRGVAAGAGGERDRAGCLRVAARTGDGESASGRGVRLLRLPCPSRGGAGRRPGGLASGRAWLPQAVPAPRDGGQADRDASDQAGGAAADSGDVDRRPGACAARGVHPAAARSRSPPAPAATPRTGTPTPRPRQPSRPAALGGTPSTASGPARRRAACSVNAPTHSGAPGRPPPVPPATGRPPAPSRRPHRSTPGPSERSPRLPGRPAGPGDVVIVQKVLESSGAVSWTVLGDDLLPVEPVEAYLAHLSALERSPNTLRAYAQGLKLWMEFLQGQRVDWAGAGVELVSRFVAWLRAPAVNVIVLDASASRRAPATVNRHLAAVFGFYDFHARAGVALAADLVAWRRVGRGSHKPFLYHVTAGKPIATRPIKLVVPRRIPVTLTDDQVRALLAACTRLRDRFLLALLAETGMFSRG